MVHSIRRRPPGLPHQKMGEVVPVALEKEGTAARGKGSEINRAKAEGVVALCNNVFNNED